MDDFFANIGNLEFRVNAIDISSACNICIDRACDYNFKKRQKIDEINFDNMVSECINLDELSNQFEPTGYLVNIIRFGFCSLDSEYGSEYFVQSVTKSDKPFDKPDFEQNGFKQAYVSLIEKIQLEEKSCCKKVRKTNKNKL